MNLQEKDTKLTWSPNAPHGEHLDCTSGDDSFNAY